MRINVEWQMDGQIRLTQSEQERIWPVQKKVERGKREQHRLHRDYGMNARV